MAQAKRKFIIVAYDVSSTPKRNKIAKMLEDYGERVNLSVFECMLTTARFVKLREKIEKQIDTETDKIVYYTVCVDCFTKIIYYPKNNTSKPLSIIV